MRGSSEDDPLGTGKNGAVGETDVKVFYGTVDHTMSTD
jgi:hypothetical protein